MRASLALFTVFIAAGASHASGQGRATGPNELTASEKSGGWRLLFDGKTFKGWRGLGSDSVPTSHWKIANGAIEEIASGKVPKMPDGQPAHGADLMTADTFGDFELWAAFLPLFAAFLPLFAAFFVAVSLVLRAAKSTSYAPR